MTVRLGLLFCGLIALGFGVRRSCNEQKGTKCSPKGDYELVQCTTNGKDCFCVNQPTGEEVPGTRREMGLLDVMTCGPSNGPAGSVHSSVYSVKNSACKLAVAKGTPCNGTEHKGIRFAFDPYTAKCLAFEYFGCDGNGNNFESEEDCLDSCLEYTPSCSGMLPPFKDSKGTVKECHAFADALPGAMDTGCPLGYTCTNDGLCCPADWEELFLLSDLPSCSKPDHYPVNHPKANGHIYGKNCSDNFCPKNSTCESGALISFCCELVKF